MENNGIQDGEHPVTEPVLIEAQEKRIRVYVKLTPTWWRRASELASADALGKAAMCVRRRWPGAEVRMSPTKLVAVVALDRDVLVGKYTEQRDALRAEVEALRPPLDPRFCPDCLHDGVYRSPNCTHPEKHDPGAGPLTGRTMSEALADERAQ